MPIYAVLYGRADRVCVSWMEEIKVSGSIPSFLLCLEKGLGADSWGGKVSSHSAEMGSRISQGRESALCTRVCASQLDWPSSAFGSVGSQRTMSALNWHFSWVSRAAAWASARVPGSLMNYTACLPPPLPPARPLLPLACQAPGETSDGALAKSVKLDQNTVRPFPAAAKSV